MRFVNMFPFLTCRAVWIDLFDIIIRRKPLRVVGDYDMLPLHMGRFIEGTQPGFPLPNLRDPPGTPTDLRKHFF